MPVSEGVRLQERGVEGGKKKLGLPKEAPEAPAEARMLFGKTADGVDKKKWEEMKRIALYEIQQADGITAQRRMGEIWKSITEAEGVGDQEFLATFHAVAMAQIDAIRDPRIKRQVSESAKRPDPNPRFEECPDIFKSVKVKDPNKKGAFREVMMFEGRYLVLRKLGEGGMGAVYLAFDSKLKKLVALKIASSKDRRDVEDGQHEVDMLRDLSFLRKGAAEQVNIPKVYEEGLHKAGYQYVTMEYIAGRTLADRARGIRRFNTEQLIAFLEKEVKPFAGTLDFLARNGVIHRDLKPDNVVTSPRVLDPRTKKVLREGRLMLVDFGLAMQRDGPQPVGEYVGALPYAAPESIRRIDIRDPEKERTSDEEKITPATDAFAFGALLANVLTGYEAPWKGEGDLESAYTYFAAVETGKESIPKVPLQSIPRINMRSAEVLRNKKSLLGKTPEKNMRIPFALAELIARLMSNDPELRFSHKGLEHMLDVVIERMKHEIKSGIPEVTSGITSDELLRWVNIEPRPKASDPQANVKTHASPQRPPAEQRNIAA